MIRVGTWGRRVAGARASPRWRRWRCSSLLVCGGTNRARAASKPTPASNDVRAQAKAAVAQAQIDYKLGRFEAALDGYRRAYELFQVPVLLFDIGQCHRNLGNPEKAKFFFEGYLREETRMDPERRHLTEELIAEATATLERRGWRPPPPRRPRRRSGG